MKKERESERERGGGGEFRRNNIRYQIVHTYTLTVVAELFNMTLQYLLAIARTCIITCIRWEPESSIISSVTEAIQLCNYTELCILCPYMYMYMYLLDITKQQCCIEWFVSGLYNYVHSST